MKNWYFFLALLFTAGLLACTSQPDRQPNIISESFKTDIKPNGLKLFTYKAYAKIPTSKDGERGMRGPSAGKAGKGERGGSQKPNLEAMKKKQKETIFTLLDIKLAETGFCQNGYTTINSYFERGRSEVRGECNDSATEDDRKKFPASTLTKTTGSPGQLSDENLILNIPK